jgi:hypothetical protein
MDFVYHAIVGRSHHRSHITHDIFEVSFPLKLVANYSIQMILIAEAGMKSLTTKSKMIPDTMEHLDVSWSTGETTSNLFQKRFPGYHEAIHILRVVIVFVDKQVNYNTRRHLKLIQFTTLEKECALLKH